MPVTKGHVVLPGTGERINCLVIDRGGNSVYTQYVGPITTGDRIIPHEGAAVLQALPSAPQDLVTVTCDLASIHLVNTHASLMRTVNVTDRSGTPRVLLADFELPPRSSITLKFGRVIMTNGLKWGASAVDVNGYVEAYTAS